MKKFFTDFKNSLAQLEASASNHATHTRLFNVLMNLTGATGIFLAILGYITSSPLCFVLAVASFFLFLKYWGIINQGAVLENQDNFLANQSTFLGNQETFLANQSKFLANQETFLVNQEYIKDQLNRIEERLCSVEDLRRPC